MTSRPTGLDKKREVIIEIGAVILKNGEITGTFNTFVSPERILNPEIIRLTGITDEMLVGAPSQEEALRMFLDFAGDRPLAAHNAEFDMGFISAGCRKYGIPFHNPLGGQPDSGPEPAARVGQVQAGHCGGVSAPARLQPNTRSSVATVAYMLPPFFEKLEAMGVHTLGEINPAMPKLRKGGGKMRRQPKHLIVLAKEPDRAAHLYKLISWPIWSTSNATPSCPSPSSTRTGRG